MRYLTYYTNHRGDACVSAVKVGGCTPEELPHEIKTACRAMAVHQFSPMYSTEAINTLIAHAVKDGYKHVKNPTDENPWPARIPRSDGA